VRRFVRRAAAASLLVLLSCAAPGLLTDGSSVSVGTFTRGLLRRGARLPATGEGYVVPGLWAVRESAFGTDELVDALRHAARRVRREYPGSLLGIGDLSLRGGGESVLHRSHQAGRDADLIFYAVDDAGKPVAPADSMPRYPAADLRAREPLPQDHGVVYGPFTPRVFDVRRNWALVRALLEEPRVEIQYLFIHEQLKQRLLEYARDQDEDPALIDRADALLHQPGDSLPHDDHLHVRVFCSQDDRPYGCADRGPVRWWKKRYKYMPPVASRGHAADLVDALTQLVTQRAWPLRGYLP
jgi:penicillin-insensitive murein DD-endopeptidase